MADASADADADTGWPPTETAETCPAGPDSGAGHPAGGRGGASSSALSTAPFFPAASSSPEVVRPGRVDPESRLHWSSESSGRSPHPLFTHEDPDQLFGRTPPPPTRLRSPVPPDRSRLPGLAPMCGTPASRGRVSVQIRVTVPLDVLTGADDTPAELAGYGPIPAATARALAADPDSVWRRLVTDPLSGALLDVGTTRYRPSAALAEHVVSRHATCQFPGCRTPAHRCDLDHNVPFGEPDGATSRANLGPKCRPHHRLKGQPGWEVRQYPDGTIEWTTPSRHRYIVEPPPVGPIPLETTAEPVNESRTDEAPPF